jgi:putative membrane protein
MRDQDFSQPRTPRQFLRLYLTGLAMGAADVVPGVSGGTMAFILGVYSTLLNAIKSFNFKALRLLLSAKIGELLRHVSFFFLVALGAGILTAVLALANALGNALEQQPTLVYAFFGGLIVASIISVALMLRWNLTAVLALIVGALFAYWLVALPELADADHSFLTLFFSGAVAICAMILPGISGSFILLILGQYKFVLDAVRALDFGSVAAVALGAAIGIVAFSRLLSWLLKHYYTATVAALVGFMIGSLRRIWIEGERGLSKLGALGAGEIALIVGLFIVGFVLVSFIDHLQSGRNPLFVRLWRVQPKEAA